MVLTADIKMDILAVLYISMPALPHNFKLVMLAFRGLVWGTMSLFIVSINMDFKIRRRLTGYCVHVHAQGE